MGNSAVVIKEIKCQRSQHLTAVNIIFLIAV